MRDQAERLRSLAKIIKAPKKNDVNIENKLTRVIAITSGKGGVGKTNFTVNLGIALTRLGKKVVIIDADLGLANIDVILGLVPKTNLGQVIKGQKTLKEIIIEGPEGLQIIAGGSGVQELANLEEWQIERFIYSLEELDGSSDIVLIDTGAGLTTNVLSFVLAADEVIVITTPEPTALTDAYAIIKVIASKNKKTAINLIVNRAQSDLEGEETTEKLITVTKHFLDIQLNSLGIIRDDSNISKAVKRQKPFLLSYPDTVASKNVSELAVALTGFEGNLKSGRGIQGFLKRMIGFLK